MPSSHAAEDLYACPVCLERFVDPRVLPGCGHSVCDACLQQICRRGDCRCPVCRMRFRPTDIQRNYALEALLSEYGGADGDTRGQHASLARSSTSQLPEGKLARSTTTELHKSRRKQLEFLGVPPRLAQSVAEEDSRVGKRIFLLDNSGSTAAYDGKIFEEKAGQVQQRSCSRWDEIKQMALEHARWNALCGTPCEFVLLNTGPPPLKAGIDFAEVDAHHTAAAPQIAALQTMLDRVHPHGGTPLAARVREIEARTRMASASLHEQGQHVVLIIVTDGLPTAPGHTAQAARQDLMRSLRQIMTSLPIKVVIRLCTDEDDVTEFYNEVEQDLELPLDVLDDPVGEAQELYRNGNGWFAYTLALHRVREGGTQIKVFDLVDERCLTQHEVALLTHYLLQEPGADPFASQPGAFCDEVEALTHTARPVYCVRRRRTIPPVDPAALRVAVLGRYKMLLCGAETALLGFMGALTGCIGHYVTAEEDNRTFSRSSSSSEGSEGNPL